MKATAAREEEFLNIQEADLLENLLRQSTLKTRKKLPSVRNLSRERGISMSTAFKAYAHPEDKGLIEARPKLGYYIRFAPRDSPHLPKI